MEGGKEGRKEDGKEVRMHARSVDGKEGGSRHGACREVWVVGKVKVTGIGDASLCRGIGDFSSSSSLIAPALEVCLPAAILPASEEGWGKGKREWW